MAYLFQNNLSGLLLSSVATSDTTASVNFGSVVPNTNVSVSSPMYLTLVNRDDILREISWEVVECTSFVAGSSAGDYTITISRGSSPLAFSANGLVENRLTAEAVNPYFTTLDTVYGWGDHGAEPYATETYVGTQIANLVDSSPAALDTLNELAAALGDDASFSTTVATSIGTKLNSSAVSTYGLTLIDDADAAAARATLGLGTAATTAASDYATAGQVLTNVPVNAVFTDTNTTYSIGNGGLTQQNFTNADHTKLNGIETGATADQTAAQILTAIKTVDGAGSGLDADLLDGLSSGSFLRSDTSDTVAASSVISFYSNAAMEATGGDDASLEIFQPTAGGDAFMQFHASGAYALYFGLDGATNDLAVGGWSKGAVKYKIWHAGNDGAGSGLDADKLDGQTSGSFVRSNTADTLTGQLTTSAGFINSEWYRSTGAVGWYNNTYAGGMFMQDTTWVRVYGSKALLVSNQIAATGNITAYYSDERLKTKTGSIDNALDKVQSLHGFTYVENELARSLGYTNEQEQVALSAQDVQRVMPQAVSIAPFDMETDEFSGEITSKSGEDYLTVDYAKMVPLLVEAIKEQQIQIDELKKTLKEIS